VDGLDLELLVDKAIDLIAVGEGAGVALEVVDLPAGADARATMHAGTCDLPSASFAALPDLKADASGRAAAEGAVLFHGTDPVALAPMADGEHVLLVRVEQVVACGFIPGRLLPRPRRRCLRPAGRRSRPGPQRWAWPDSAPCRPACSCGAAPGEPVCDEEAG